MIEKTGMGSEGGSVVGFILPRDRTCCRDAAAEIPARFLAGHGHAQGGQWLRSHEERPLRVRSGVYDSRKRLAAREAFIIPAQPVRARGRVVSASTGIRSVANRAGRRV